MIKILSCCFSAEFAYAGKVTPKADVFSFGVIIMEFLTKKRPTSGLEENGMPITLQQYVEKFLAHGVDGVPHFLDPQLLSTVKTAGEKEKIVKLLELALFCTRQLPEDRPDMNEVLSTLLKISNKN